MSTPQQITVFPQQETTLLLPGPAGKLEVIASPSTMPSKVAVLICHPHPPQGGTMHNKVVTTLARVFRDLGHTTLRFNFRGVGQSEGVYDGGRGETDDLLYLAQWVRQVLPHQAIWLAGFSFGCYVAVRAAATIQPERLIMVAPAVMRFDFSCLPQLTCPSIVVQGEDDEVIEPQAVYDWVARLQLKPTLIRLPATGHFFHGQLLELHRQLLAAISAAE